MTEADPAAGRHAEPGEARSRLDGLLRELDMGREAFLSALDDVEPELMTTPGVVDGWSAHDLVAHVAYWSQHGADALDLATSGRGTDFAYDRRDTDAMNARVAEEGRTITTEAALEREASAFAAFRERVAALDTALLDLRLGNGDTVAEVIGYDGLITPSTRSIYAPGSPERRNPTTRRGSSLTDGPQPALMHLVHRIAPEVRCRGRFMHVVHQAPRGAAVPLNPMHVVHRSTRKASDPGGLMHIVN